MNIIKSLIVASSLLASSAYADGFGFNLGPFDMQFDTDGGDYQQYNNGQYTNQQYSGNDARNAINNPICDAISNLKRIEIVVEGSENVSTKEKKIITKKLVVEPYAFGVTRDGKPILRGNVVSEKLVQEVSVKYGEDKFDESSVASKDKDKNSFSGKFSSEKNKNIDIRKISNIRVIDESHFDAPKDYKGITEENIQVICQVPVAEKK